MTETTTPAGASQEEIEAQHARYITRPSRPTPYLVVARVPANRARRLAMLVVTLGHVAAIWALLYYVGIPAFVDTVDLVFRGSHAANRNGFPLAGVTIAVMAAYFGVYAVLRLRLTARELIWRHAPQRIIDPLPFDAVDVETELGRDHRTLLVGLRDRSMAPHPDLYTGRICATNRRLLWDLAVAARIHRKLVLDTVARPELTIAHDPRPNLLEELQAQIDFLAAVVDTGLSAPGRCMCAQPTWTLEEQLAAATQRAAALIPDARRAAWVEQW